MNKENGGFTLVELVIAIAISIIIVGSVASFVYFSTGNYSRTKDEICLQMEAQIMLNQLNHMMMEADNVKFDSDTHKLKIKQGDSCYIIALDDSDNTLLFEKVPVGSDITGSAVLFGKYVETFEVVDTGLTDTNRRIEVSLSLVKNKATYSIRDSAIMLRNRISLMEG